MFIALSWDEGVHFVLLESRGAVEESLGFSPFKLVFGHAVRGPLKVAKEVWLQDEPVTNLLDYISDMRQRAHKGNCLEEPNTGSVSNEDLVW